MAQPFGPGTNKGTVRLGPNPVGIGGSPGPRPQPAEPSSVDPSMPKRPTERTPLSDLKPDVQAALRATAIATEQARSAGIPVAGKEIQGSTEEPTEASSQGKAEAPKTEVEAGIAEIQKLLAPPEGVLANEARRKSIESRCSDMSIDDLLAKDEVRQEVPIVPGKMVVIFRSKSMGEGTFVGDLHSRTGQNLFQVYQQDLRAIYDLVCCLVSINGVMAPSHLDAQGAVDPKKFDAKLEYIKRKPEALIGDLSLNASWFMARVLSLFKDQSIKNG